MALCDDDYDDVIVAIVIADAVDVVHLLSSRSLTLQPSNPPTDSGFLGRGIGGADEKDDGGWI